MPSIWPRLLAARRSAATLLLVGVAVSSTPFATLQSARAQTAEREVDLRFLPPGDPVDGYRFHFTSETTGVTTQLDVGFVAPDASGVCHSPVAVDASPYRVAMTAYNAAGESPRSNEIRIAALCDASACDDGDPCTADACDAQGDCAAQPLADGSACDDGLTATQGDRCVAGTCVGVAPALVVSAVDPSTVRPGKTDLLITGNGFAVGATLRFQNGTGPAPRVLSLRLVDAARLAARIDVPAKRPARTRYFDVVVALPDGSQATLSRGLRIDP